MPKLNPCRICGRGDCLEFRFDTSYRVFYKIRCNNCGYSEMADSREAVEQAWNRRAKETTTIQPGKSTKRRHTRQDIEPSGGSLCKRPAKPKEQ
jgi:predicted nucleic-acid-binding Zn-ribbon protein